MFKDKNSLDREAAIAGVRNAAWDLTQLSDLARRVNESGPDGRIRYLFATFDKHLRRTARLLFQYATDQRGASHLAPALSQWWPPKDAQRIAAMLFDHIERVELPEWSQKLSPRPSFIKELIDEGERGIRTATPRSRS